MKRLALLALILTLPLMMAPRGGTQRGVLPELPECSANPPTGACPADKYICEAGNSIYRCCTACAPTGWTKISGDVTGPGSSTDNCIVRFDGTGGTTLQQGTLCPSYDDSGIMQIGGGGTSACILFDVTTDLQACFLESDDTLYFSADSTYDGSDFTIVPGSGNFDTPGSGVIDTNLTVGGTLQLSALDCSGLANSGALTTDASGNVVCSADDGGGAAGDWTTTSNVVHLNTLTDAVTVGTTTNLGKLAVDGDTAAEIQLIVQGAGSQSADLFVVEASDGTDLVTIDASGDLIVEPANRLVTPQGAAPTVDTAGQVAVDTTQEQLLYDGGSVRVLDYRMWKSVTLETPTDADNFLLFKAPYDLTITDIFCIVDPAGTGESVVIDVQERDANGDTPVTVDATITCSNTGAEDDASLTNGPIDSGDWVSLDIGTVTGTVTQVSVTIHYTIDRK